MKCPYCKRRIPDKKWLTKISKFKKCIWCDADYRRSLCKIKKLKKENIPCNIIKEDISIEKIIGNDIQEQVD